MERIDLDALEMAPISNDPFPHVILPNFIPRSQLGSVITDLPQIPRGGSFPIDSLRFGSNARALLDALHGTAFRDIIARKFDIDLSGAACMTTLRGRSREKDGRIHCDSTSKRVTVLLYLNHQSASWEAHQGCLRLLRGPETLDEFVVEVPPVNGTLLVFPNSSTAWHGHKTFVGPRHVLQLNYMTGDAAARSEIRRHRISAFLKRLAA